MLDEFKRERVARGVLNKCLELWTASSSGQNKSDFGVEELRNQLITFDARNGNNLDKDVTNKPPLQYVLGKTDETSLPAHDKALSFARKKPYVVVQNVPEQDLQSEYGLGSAGRDELLCKEIELSYEEQKVLIRKLKKQVIHQQRIIEKLRGVDKVEGTLGKVDPESVPSVSVYSP